MTRWKWIVIGIALVIAAPSITMMVLQLTAPKTRSFTLQYLTGAEAAGLLNEHKSKGRTVESAHGNVVFVRGSRRELAAAGELLTVYDVPKPQVALKFQIVEANGFTGRDSAIANVESVLRDPFRFQGYHLVTEAFIRSKEKSDANQVLTGSDGIQYSISVEVADVLRHAGKTSAEIKVQLLGKSAVLWSTLLSTSVQVPDGQTVVLGTARPNAERGALILVVTPEIR